MSRWSVVGLLVLSSGSGFSGPLQEGPQREKPVVSKELESQFRRTYSAELSSKARESVAKLFDDAVGTKDEPAVQFLLLELAAGHAGNLFDFAGAFKAIEKQDELFKDVHPIASKLRVLDEARKRRSKVPEQLEALLAADFELALQAFLLGPKNSSYYELASTAAQNAEEGARSLKAKPTEDRADALAKYAKDLFKDKADAVALVKARYFILGLETEEVLSALSGVPEARLKKFAGLSFLKPSTPEGTLELGDAAFEAAGEGGRHPHEKRFLQNRSLELYRSALAIAVGATKTKLERDEKLRKRMQEIDKAVSGGGQIDLLALVDPKFDALSGVWKRAGAKLISDTAPFARLEIPYELSEEYDLRVSYERDTAEWDAAFLLTRGGRQFSMSVYDKGSVRFHHSGPSVEAVIPVLQARIPHTVLVQVRSAGIKVVIDGHPPIEWKPDPQSLGPNPSWTLKNPKAVGVGSHLSAITFLSAQLTEVTGRGRRTR